ncbi:phage portal protein [Rathayibacter sp. VKM Ac-2927]|uniref:phage portal protein n=1 Tax=Rathayibacter sp. VKM Ac-2927 TaxID=2929478 RepID=UPI001FB2461C|nr:phage portal protein [Rathayibacter sp. VKM Ac-2927]MCJ1687777.1 phage portal protein [Rathayibacter sp. VKM Ac-2927]
MGLLDILRGTRPDYRAGVPVEYISTTTSSVLGLSTEELWETQPALRSVVSFRARNIAQLGIHTFQRLDDDDRRRTREDPVAQLLKRPNASMTSYELIYDLVSTIDLYDIAYWLLAESDTASGWEIRPIPAAWVVGNEGGDFWAPEKWIVAPPGKESFKIDAENVLPFVGWNPIAKKQGKSPIEALKSTLAEQIQASEYRQQVWARGGRVGTVIERPAGEWGEAARKRFTESFKNAFSGRGSKAGGTLLLEDGMKMSRVGFSAHEEEYIDAAKLAISTVASVYHVNPTMIGQLDNANFSNVREFRRMLYSETLGPLMAQIEDRLNTFLVPRVAAAAGIYVEFNIAEKLQGSFEEQAAGLSTSVGRPWMTADEARSRNNMPALGGDAAQLATPLNVLMGGQASPRDSAPKSGRKAPRSRVSLKSDDLDTTSYVEKAAEVLSTFFARQRRAVLSALGAKAAGDYWDGARWDRELSDDLYALAMTTATELGQEQAKRLGFTEGDYDEDRTRAFLRAVADSRAGAINSTTKERLDDAIDDDDADPADVFAEAESARSGSAATALVAGLAGFALVEAAQQTTGSAAQKTWETGDNPRPDHAAMDGETVGIDEQFSNGADWPGDPVLGADGVSGCNCGVSISY